MSRNLNSALVLVVILGTVLVNGSPVLKELPSITTDTLIEYKDSEPAESVGPVTGAIMGYNAFNTIRNMANMFRFEKPQEPQGIMYYLSPMRIARSLGSEAWDIAKTFASTFGQEFKNQYKVLSTEVKDRVIPEAANLFGVWEVPPRESEWLEGV